MRVGPHVRSVELPRVCESLLDSVSVADANPYLSTDGVCLFSKDGTRLISCVARVSHYQVPATCLAIEAKAFAYNSMLESIELPDGLEEIGDRAFAATRLSTVAIPATVRTIGTEAFARNPSLRSVELAEGLLEIGEGAFKGCDALERLAVPASVRYLGNDFFRLASMKAASDVPPVTINPANRHYFVDEQSVLYRKGAHGMTLINAFTTVLGAYRIAEGTVRIEVGAFAHCDELTCVWVPEGVVEIKEEAFLGCSALEVVYLPSSLERIEAKAFAHCRALQFADFPDNLTSIGSAAFYHTALDRLRIPAKLEFLGHLALFLDGTAHDNRIRGGHGVSFGAPIFTGDWLVMGNSAAGRAQRALADEQGGQLGAGSHTADITVDPGNPYFFMMDDFLCEWLDNGSARAVLYAGEGRTVVVPRCVSWVCSFALHRAHDVRELSIHSGLTRVDDSGLTLPKALDVLHIADEEGRDICLYPAAGQIGVFAQNHGYSQGFLDVKQMVSACDNSLTNMKRGFERTRRIVKRLENGELLSDASRRIFEQAVADKLDDTIAGFARIDDYDGLKALMNLGFIDASSIAHAIDVANAAGGVGATHFLLDEKRKLGSRRALDLEL